MRERLPMGEAEAIPPAARLLRDFVNTRELQVDGESLASVEQLREWLGANGLLTAGARLNATHLASAIAIREGLRTIWLANAGHGSDPSAVRKYNTALAELPLRLVYSGGSHRLVAAHDAPAAHALSLLLDAIRQCEQDGTWHRLKVCARDTCRWAFYDASRNQTRRWCSMAGCGNHIKMKRAYATRRNRRQHAAGGVTDPGHP